MFKRVKGSFLTEEIQGLKCHWPKKPANESIEGFGRTPKKQKWKRTELPSALAQDTDVFSGAIYAPDETLNWNQIRREEYIAQTGLDPWSNNSRGGMKEVRGVVANEYYKNPVLEEFRKQEFDRIHNGYWFYNKGKPTYVTGYNYFYLNYWKLNTGYPDYRDTDRQLFNFWQFVLEDSRCYGLIEITKRGVGKSYRMGAVAYLQTVLYSNVHVGIQSKTDDDAEEMFINKVVEPYKTLPEFLNPLNDHGSEPKSKLSFFPPANRSRTQQFQVEETDSLRSVLTYRNATERAYDGTTLKFLIQDEVAKLEPKIGDAQKRLGVNKNCVYRDSKMVGKIWCSTTVEDMDKGGEPCKKIWYTSDTNNRSSNGRTTSGLYPFFQSALECSHFDEWGFPDRVEAKKEHDGERKNKEGDSVEWVGYIQRNPYNIEEAFMTQGKDCIYNAKILQERQSFLQDCQMTTRGDLEWIDGIEDGKVQFVPNDKNGRWEFSWFFPDDEKQANAVKRTIDAGGFKLYTPKNDEKFGIAYDPFSHTQTVDKRRSNAAIAVYRNYHPWLDPEESDTFVADYVARPDDPEESYEDLIKTCVYFGTSVLIENNKNDCIRYFYKRGYGDFIMQRPDVTLTSSSAATDGIPSSTPVIEYYIKRMKHHVVKHGHKLKHLRIVRDLLEFNPSNRTKYDLGVASQLSVVASERFIFDEDEEEKNTHNVDELFF